MSWLFSQALVAAYSAGSYLGGEPSARSSSTDTPQAYCAPDKMTAFSRLSRFGMMFAPLMDGHGEALLTWFQAGFPAKTSAWPAKDLDWLAREADSGPKCLREHAAKWHELYEAVNQMMVRSRS
jgi:hypothetical protein